MGFNPFNNFADYFKNMGKNWDEALLVLTFGVVGDIMVRINSLNGSLDNYWTLFFLFPPFSIVSAYTHLSGEVKKAEKGSEPIDDYTYVLFISSIISGMLFKSGIFFTATNMVLGLIIEIIIDFGLFFLVRYLRRNKDCGEDKSDSLFYTANQSIQAIGGALAANIIIMLIAWIPILGILAWAYRLFLKFIPGGAMAIPLTVINILLNMSTNTWKSERDKMCKSSEDFSKITTILTVVGTYLGVLCLGIAYTFLDLIQT